MLKSEKLITERQYLESVRIINQYLLQQTPKKRKRVVYINKIDMSVRLRNILEYNNIETLCDLSEYHIGDIYKWRNIGKKTLKELLYLLDLYKINVKS